MNTHYREINLKNDRVSNKSIFEFYKALLKLRKEHNEIIYGDLSVLSNDADKYFVFEREYEGEKLIICCNFEDENKIELPYSNVELLLSNSAVRTDCSVDYKPYEIAVYKLI